MSKYGRIPTVLASGIEQPKPTLSIPNMKHKFFFCALVCALVCSATAQTADLSKAAPIALPANLRLDLIGWFDAADDASFVMDGEGVAVWKDKSGQQHDLSQTAANSRPLRAKEKGVSTVQGAGNRTMLAENIGVATDVMTVHALVSVPPGNTPILSFDTQGKPEFVAAGWTIGAHPTFYSASGSAGAQQEVEDSQWHILTFVRDKTERRFYMDGVFAGSETSKDDTVTISDFHLFAFQNAATFNGKLAELLIYRASHDAKQVAATTAYLHQKWQRLFPDRKSTFCAFVGNSLTTGMFCGNGQTWSAKTAAKIPGLKSWCNISQGGITTQGLAALSPEKIDRLLPLRTGASVLVFWEGTSDLVVNNASAEAAHEAIKQFCIARRKAGWKKIVVMTPLPREAGGDFEARRSALNQLLREHSADYSDVLADIASNDLIGKDGDQKNKDYFTDAVHLTAKGNEVVAGIVAAKLAPLVAL